MIVIGLALAICIVGLVIYLVAANPKAVEVGKWMFIIGLFSFLCCGGPEWVKILGRQ